MASSCLFQPERRIQARQTIPG